MKGFTEYFIKSMGKLFRHPQTRLIYNIKTVYVTLIMLLCFCLLIDLHDIFFCGVSFIFIALASFDKIIVCDKFPCGFTPVQFPEKIFFKDTDLVYRMASHTYAEYLNSTIAEIQGQTDFDLFPPELAQQLEDDDRKVLENQKTHEFIYEYQSNAKRQIIKTIKSIMIDKTGKMVGISGIMHDVSEATLLQEQLAENQRKLSTLLSNLPGMAYRCLNDTNWSMEFVSNGCEELTGYPASTLINDSSLSYNSLIYEADRKMVWDVIQRQIEQHKQFDIEYRIVCRDGQIKWVSERGVAVYGADNTVIALEGFITDITKLKTTTKKLEQSEKTLMTLLQSAPIGIGLVKKRVLGWVNKQISEITGYKFSELEEKNVQILYPTKEEYLRLGKEQQAVIRKDGIGETYAQWLRKDGDIRNVFLKLAPLNPLDFDEGFIFTAVDVTERIQAQEERESLIKQLEDQNAQLEQFTYTVSHDLKSPIITIDGFVSMLSRYPAIQGSKELQNIIIRIRNATKIMGTLLTGLLELSRVGRIINPPEPYPLSKLIEDALELVSGRIEQNSIKINADLDLPVVSVDSKRIVMVLMNLIDNAAKAVEHVENPQITIGQTTNNSEIVFFIKDNGVGIEEKYFGKIFGLFNKLESNVEGTGIGLALVKRIIEFHGGRIWVESDGLNQGSTFYFTLPLHCP